MPIRLICVCGRAVQLPTKYAGQHVECADCRAMLHIPTAEEDLDLTRWYCKCGLRLKARPKSAGRRIRCPRCSAEVTVPLLEGRPTFVEEKFEMKADTGIVQRVAEGPAEEVPTKEALAPTTPAHGTEPEVNLDTHLELETLSEEEELELPTEETPPEPQEIHLQGRKEASYAVASPARAAAKPAGPGPSPKPAPVAEKAAPEEEWAIDAGDEEGIRARELARYFNATSGGEAARAGALQVLHGYWLYIPYALLAGCMSVITQIVLARTGASLGGAIGGLLLPGLVTLFLWSGFVACIKDGVFERSMGIERMVYNAARHFLRFSGTVLMMIPVAVGLALAAVFVFGGVWTLVPGLLLKLAGLVLLIPIALFLFALFNMPPAVTVLEKSNPFASLGRGLLFGFQHTWGLLSLAVVSMFVGGGIVGAVYLFFWLAKLLLSIVLPPWIFDALWGFLGGLMLAAIMGQIVASVMLLYLSSLPEHRLQAIRKDIRGPPAVPSRLYVAIGVAAVALLILSYTRSLGRPGMERDTEDIAPHREAPISSQELPSPQAAPATR